MNLANSANPVLARILSDLRMTHTDLGALALACAAIGDVTAWCLLAFVVGVVNSSSGGLVAIAVPTIVFIAVMFVVVRPLVTRWIQLREAHEPTPLALAATLVAVLISAFANNKDLATTFLTECINNKEASLAFFEGQPRPPARKDAYDEVKSDPYIQGFGAAAIEGEAQPNIKEMGAVWEAWTKAYQSIFNGGDGTKAFQDAAAEIDAKIASGG